MKRSGFKPKFPPRPVKQMDDYHVKPRAAAVAVSDGKARMVVPVPKREYVRSEEYRRLVAALPCAHCGVQGYSQAAHSDDNGAGGKGMSIKADDSTCYPACGPHPGPDGQIKPGCHWVIGTSGKFTKAERHAMEAVYAQRTRDTLGFNVKEKQHA